MTPDTSYLAPDLRSATWGALVVGVAALSVSLAGAFMNPRVFFGSYLIAFVFCVNIAIGSLGLMMLNYLTGGTWGLVIRRISEAATRTLPLLAILFLPIVFGIHYIYEWSNKEVVEANAVLQTKTAYLNVPFFIIRAGIYFAVWGTLTYALNRWSLRQDSSPDPISRHRLGTLSGPGMVLLAITITFASIDWLMSLDPVWHSTMYPVIVAIGQFTVAMCFAIAIAAFLMRRGAMATVFTPGHFHDLGNLLLAFVMLWAYVSFSQFLIIWSGNVADETPYYLRRLGPEVRYVALALVVLHFAIPFLLLLMRDIKRNPYALLGVVALVMFMRFVDLFWLVAPSMRRTTATFQWTDIVALIGVGGIWIAAFFWQLGKRPLMPLNDPHLPEVFLRDARH